MISPSKKNQNWLKNTKSNRNKNLSESQSTFSSDIEAKKKKKTLITLTSLRWTLWHQI